MKQLILATQSSAMESLGHPDVKDWAGIYNLISKNVNIIDRCEHLITPFNFKSVFPIPATDNFNKTYEEVCIESAQKIIAHSRAINKPILIMYSGGIDSTVVAVSFMIAAEGDYSNLKIALSTHSIRENANFYYDHIRGKIEVIPSETALDSITSDYIIVGGEGNDQLFGTDIYKTIRNYAGIPFIHQPYTEQNITDFFKHYGLSERQATVWYSLMHDQIRATQIADITTVKDFFWWYNFCYKWQNVYFRIPARSTSSQPLSKEFLDTYYFQFFMNDDFQRWSILNPDKKIEDTWKSYKKAAKEFIYKFNDDREYFLNKTKVPSLINIFRQRKVHPGIDSNYSLMTELDPAEYYNPNNSFANF
jgi:hypothetical protein